ncbi:lysine-ketoglutarate reductase saccharopine dehydrogenase enzyme, putative (macronuclear) [Tetrahymena thermophila SB210]|uniref:Lysine-ketoglutarate reductase saccharopine dehydrogenase enzyme, putative n=1 Tax=Tetrahymena thermophila (strain SB210) TaxID=312017 RepID=I7ML79_TETTS|nr:lysine-ketoglutarate reductase saccharopine dehydrogenase enzyme, putative [Tetrahymena thermophila SB210]EAS01335.1 lysine-ketoglutarate reductase saccharopine dehydrogenase enzyme, putative [Tetrahymena thermophila SB210]|eukprot:XP_001021580.1 lysine-ketoglutarate reductase saccharopine dehydrogenase enzyme, putative [Tetrahymena thermophila SB210]
MSEQNKIIYVGVRAEDKSHWERRVPIIPKHVREIHDKYPYIKFIVEPCTKRVFSNKEYENAGAIISSDLTNCSLIICVKEVPIEKLYPQKTYMFFSHTIKAQKQNMAALDDMIQKKIRLIDYEKITDEKNNRLVAFGRFAGIAGTIDYLSGLGQYLMTKSISTAFLNISMSYKYFNLEQAYLHLKSVGQQLESQEIPKELRPLVFAVTGTGRCANGAWEVLENLPIKKVSPDELKALHDDIDNPAHATTIYCCSILPEHMVEHSEHKDHFEKKHYYENPHEYVPIFHEKYLPYISSIFHNMYWDYKFPRLITDQHMKELAQKGKSKLLGISDVTCDLEGSIEFLKKFTTPDQPFYVYEPIEQKIYDDLKYRDNGILYLALDFLPCELPFDASTHFSNHLKEWIPNIAESDISLHIEESGLIDCIKRAVITHNGDLTHAYQYIRKLRDANERIEASKNFEPKRGLSKKVQSFSSLKIEGHIFDTGAINKILDICQKYEVKFNVADILVGQNEDQTSQMLLQLYANNHESMIEVIEQIEVLAEKINLVIYESLSSAY